MYTKGLTRNQHIMAKRKTGVSPKKMTRHPHKTATRLAAKKVMLETKKKKTLRAPKTIKAAK